MTYRTVTVRRSLFTIVFVFVLSLVPATASAKQVVDFFGTQSGTGTLGGQFKEPSDVDVNQTGNGPADAGDVYVVDRLNNRIQRIGHEDNGTPLDPTDDSYFFISAWGADVVGQGGSGDQGDASDAEYEICTVASECKAGVPSGGNGTASGNGALSLEAKEPIFLTGPTHLGIAVDQDSGNVYVSDGVNSRVNVYDGDGTFLRSFGFGVVASGPNDAGTGYETCVAVDGDACREGEPGTGVGQIAAGQDVAVSQPDGNPATGTVFLANSGSESLSANRVNTYDLDGSDPSSFGSAAVFHEVMPNRLAVDSRGIVYASNSSNSPVTYEIERYDTENANGGGVDFLAPIPTGVNEVQQVTVAATSGTFNLTFDPDGGEPQPPETTIDLPYNTPAQESGPPTPGVIDAVQEALEALPSIGAGGSLNAGGVIVNGGPGNATGSSPYTITARNALSARDLTQLVPASGAPPLSGGAGASSATITPGQSGLAISPSFFQPRVDFGLTVDPATDTLYVLRAAGGPGFVQQFGPVNRPGLTAPPTADDERHGTNPHLSFSDFKIGTLLPSGIALDELTGRLLVGSEGVSGFGHRHGLYVLGDVGPAPTAAIDSVTDVTASTATINATIDPNGPPALSYRFEYSLDGSIWRQLPSIPLGAQEDPQQVSALLDPPGGLEPNTLYHVRVVAQRPFFRAVTSAAKTFTTSAGAPGVETTGAPVRTATTAQLGGRVNPRNAATIFHFEYGAEGPCSANACQATAPVAAGSGGVVQLVSTQLEELEPDTTYHYRVVAESSAPGSPAFGGDMTVRTRASDQPLSRDSDLAGPPGSDRAWEQVNAADTGGNPVGTGVGFSVDGNRALYQIIGGAPVTDVGSLANFLLAERTEAAPHKGSWQTVRVSPPREQLIGSVWGEVRATPDLSSLIAVNFQVDSVLSSAWRLGPVGSPSELFRTVPPVRYGDPNGEGQAQGISADGSRAIVLLGGGTPDPDHPAAGAKANLYDVSAGGDPQLVSLLPGNTVPACGVPNAEHKGFPSHSSRWISADGNLVFFRSAGSNCSGPPQLYVRDLAAGETRLVSGPSLLGGAASVNFLRGTPDAAFFWTQTKLVAEDPGGADVYRYDLNEETLECVTCVAEGLSVDVAGGTPSEIAVAGDGSRVYFTSSSRLLPGAPPVGQPAAYRVEVGTGDLAYIATGIQVGSTPVGNALSADGSTLVFRSSSAALNPLGGVADNGGTAQYYRYDDEDRSIVCVSCPQDGDGPLGAVPANLAVRDAAEAGVTPISADGETFAFAAATSLVDADQNTATTDPDSGTDIYEWRDGRLLLVTDGLTNWPDLGEPALNAVSPSGRDVFFSAPARYTPDAIDGYRRLYDARIGGGFEFPPPPPPCPLEVCQGTPKGAPTDAAPASLSFSGRGNVSEPPTARKCPKGKRRTRRAGKVRCVNRRQAKKQTGKQKRRTAKHNGRGR